MILLLKIIGGGILFSCAFGRWLAPLMKRHFACYRSIKEGHRLR